MNNPNLKAFIEGIPKAELHLHIEGSFEPELMFEIAQRNGVKIKFASVEAVKEAYKFNNLQEFLDIYYEGANVLLYEQDFYDLSWAYFKKVHSQNLVYAEIFFDPQTHTDRGISFETVITGIKRALDNAKDQLGIEVRLIMSFLRHLSEEAAIETLNEALPYKDWIIGVGLDSSEVGNPPSKFRRVFEMARKEGFIPVAHAGEEGPPEYIWEALNLLKIERLDHGNRCMEDEALIKELADRKMALTLCPLSNLELKVISELKSYPLKEMMAKGLLCTLNSDDPAYFGGYMNENYWEVAQAIDLDEYQIYELVKNSFQASFLSEEEKASYIQKLDTYYQAYLQDKY